MAGIVDGTCGFVRVVVSGDIEVELFDYSDLAHSTFGGDIVTVFTIKKDDFPKFADLLALRFGRLISSQSKMVEMLTAFSEVDELIDWLKNSSEVSVSKCMDFNV
jgi:hypothetical protein